MRPEARALQREQLDRQFRALRTAKLARPPRGWIKAIRDALGMNGRQLADRMGIVRSHLSQLEKAEVCETATISSLRRAAEALGCDLVYGFVPRDGATFAQLVYQQAQAAAERIVEEVATSMALEAQSVDRVFRKREVNRIATELVTSMPRDFWDR